MGRAKPKLIAYRRVATARQGASGLGLEGQDAAVAAYAHQAGAVVLRVDTEVETGRRTDRPELARALADGTRSRAVGKFLLTQMAAVAELEAGLIRERTKAALAAYEARGGLPGSARPAGKGHADRGRNCQGNVFGPDTGPGDRGLRTYGAGNP